MRQGEGATTTEKGGRPHRLEDTAIRPLDMIQMGPDGAILVGGTRMALIEIVGGFYSIRKSLEENLGEVAAVVLYEAGLKGSLSFVDNAVRGGFLTKSARGYGLAVGAYSRAGFGGFEVTSLDFEARAATIECVRPMTFEAYAFNHVDRKTSVPVCDYSRGVFAGFMRALAGRDGAYCVEWECRAADGRRCLFEVGDKVALAGRIWKRRRGASPAVTEGSRSR